MLFVSFAHSSAMVSSFLKGKCENTKPVMSNNRKIESYYIFKSKIIGLYILLVVI